MRTSAMKFVRRGLMVVALVGIAAVFYWNAFHNDRVIARDLGSEGTQRVTLLSRSHTIDRIYMSMQGPFSNHGNLLMDEAPKRELIWLRGIRVDLVGRDGEKPISREFFCHSNLTFNLSRLIDARKPDGPFTATQDYRLFTLIPGRMQIELPAGFGVPVYSDEPLDNLSMSLNMNEKDGSRQVRFKTTIEFARDSAAMKPLFRRAIYGYEPVGKMSPHTMCTGGNSAGAACGPFVGREASSNAFVASLGKTNTVHWMIPSGNYESRVPVNDQLDLPYDTAAHYVTAHLHPYGKSVSLVDKTTKQTIFEIRSKDYADKLGVDQMDEISLTHGIELFKDHDYELVTIYHNPTNAPIDAMSIMYLYCLDKKFLATR